MDVETFGALASFEVLAYAVAANATVLRGNAEGAWAVLSEDIADAPALLTRAEAIAAATGEHVWDAQLAARRLRLAARQRTKRA